MKSENLAMTSVKSALIVSCFDWYEKRLKYVEHYLTNKGYVVSVVTSDFDHIKKTKIEKKYNKIRYISVPEYKKNISLNRIRSHIKFANEIGKYIKENIPQLVYALIPPNYLLKVLADNKDLLGYKLIVDVIDLWPESFPIGSTTLFPFTFWKSLRTNNINAADQIILECGLYKESLCGNVADDKVHVLYLTGEKLNKEYKEKIEKKSEDKIILGYLGSINSLIDIDRIRDLIDCLQKRKNVEVEIIGTGNKTEEFINRLKEVGCKIHYYGMIFDEEKKFEILRKCHFGINIYKKKVKIGLTIKSIDYFRYGLPILNSIPGDTEKIVEKYNAGINVSAISQENLCREVDKYQFEARNIMDMYEELFCESNMDSRLGFLDL